MMAANDVWAQRKLRVRMYVCMCERSLYGRGSIKSIRTNYVLIIPLKLQPWFNVESQMLNLDNECKNFTLNESSSTLLLSRS